MKELSLQEVNRRNRLSQWSSQIAECRNSGLTVRQWCENHGIPQSTYYTWQKQVFQAMSCENEFVEVHVQSEPERCQAQTIATVSVGGITAEVHVGTDEASMVALFRAMKTC